MPLLIFVSPSLMPPPPPLPTNTFRPMILDEQSQKQNELEQPRWEQMACNCLAEEARESIFTHPGGAAVAKRRRRGGKKCRCICFDQIWPGGSIWKIFITHIRERNSKSVVGETRYAIMSFHHAKELYVWLSQQQQMNCKFIPHWTVAKTVNDSDGSSRS